MPVQMDFRGPFAIRLRLKQQGENLKDLKCEVDDKWEVVQFGSQGWNPEKRGWQPYLLVVMPADQQSALPPDMTWTFDREVVLGRVEIIELMEA